MIYFKVGKFSAGPFQAQGLPFLKQVREEYGIPVRIFSLESEQKYHTEIHKNQDIPITLRKHYGNKDVRTYINVLRLYLCAFLHLVRHKDQTVIGGSPMLFPFLFSAKAVIIDLRGVFMEETVINGLLSSNSLLYIFLKKIFDFTLRKARHVFCVSEALSNYVYKITGNSRKNTVVPCCIDPILMKTDRDKVKTLRKELGLEEKFILIYAGSLTAWNLVPPMLRLFEKIERLYDKSHFLFLTKQVAEAQRIFRNSSIHPSRYTIKDVRHDEIQHYLHLGDLGLLLREDNIVNNVASPVKFAEYLACGIPVFATGAVFDVRDTIMREKVGFVIPYKELESLDYQYLQQIITDVKRNRSEYRMRCKEIGRKYFLRSKYSRRYDKVFLNSQRAIQQSM